MRSLGIEKRELMAPYLLNKYDIKKNKHILNYQVYNSFKMPELPEAYITSVQLNSSLVGWSISKIEILENAKHDCMESITFPQRITSVYSVGKKVVFVLQGSDGEIGVVITSLGMTGHWGYEKRKHCQLILHLENQGSQKKLYYDDIRRFGRNCYVKNDDEYKSKIPKGLCYLRNRHEITFERFRDAIRKPSRKRMNICKFLMCQDYFAGVGNYIKCESLYLAKINPQRKLETLTDDEISTLLQAIIWVIDTSIRSNGLTISDFSTPNEDKGVYDTFVYGKTVDRHGNPVVKQEFDDKRTTHWVPQVQL